jgi:hypothetical protein
MVPLGVLVMRRPSLPLFDDGGVPDSQTEHECTLICMSVPLLGFAGLLITFSALFSKMRINRIFHPKFPLGVKVTIGDVMGFVALLSANIVVLACWTVIDPLTYVREGPG